MGQPQLDVKRVDRPPLHVVRADERLFRGSHPVRTHLHPKLFYALMVLTAVAIPLIMVWDHLASEQRARHRDQRRQHQRALAQRAFLHKSRPTYHRLKRQHRHAHRQSFYFLDTARDARAFAGLPYALPQSEVWCSVGRVDTNSARAISRAVPLGLRLE